MECVLENIEHAFINVNEDINYVIHGGKEGERENYKDCDHKEFMIWEKLIIHIKILMAR